MERIIYTNKNGKQIAFDQQYPFVLKNKDGFGNVENVIQTEKGYNQDGASFVSSNLEIRNLIIKGFIEGSDYKDLLRNKREMIRTLNPKMPGILEYQNDLGTFYIDVIPEFAPVFDEANATLLMSFQVVWKALDPYWYTQDETDQLAAWEGGLRFPLVFPTAFSRLSTSKSKLLVNNGDVETPIIVTFNGPVTAPITIKNVTNDKYMTVNRGLIAGERLEISTKFGNKKAIKILADGSTENATHYLKIPGSEFFNLEVGNNLIEYSTGIDYEQAGVSVQWRNRYLAM